MAKAATKFRHPLGDGKSLLTITNDGDGYKLDQDFNKYNSDFNSYHLGEDWNGEGGGNSDLGDPVFAIANGIVVDVDEDGLGGFGRYVVIRHDLPTAEVINGHTVRSVYSLYAHLDDSSFVNEGDNVGIGMQIGTVGNTGATGGIAHLHFEITLDPKLPTSDNGYNLNGASSYWVDPTDFIYNHQHIVESKNTLKNGIKLTVDFENYDGNLNYALSDGYFGFDWDDFQALNPDLFGNIYNGYENGTISGSFVGYNEKLIDDHRISSLSRDVDFDFISGFFTAAWNSDLNLKISGFDNGVLVAEEKILLSTEDPTFYNFGKKFISIDELVFESFGGIPGPTGTIGHYVAFDDLTFVVYNI